MRIISGKYRGKVIRVPKGLPVRPTTDRTKEALFNILGNYLDFEDLKVLDLCTGTGGITMECLSRGAKRVVAVDKARTCIRALQTNIKALDASEQTQLVNASVEKFLKGVPEEFDFIFMDPPYAMGGQEALIESILTGGWLEEDGILVVEHSSHKDFEKLAGFDYSKKYGDSSLSFFYR
ncbi:16S rRNA (guanine(966)-N(2))-methyltransferase RsmD [bacterium]|nr:16S rRNA (guanine(966)-N(2))-methyltransferase RsmD [bacterium]